MGRRAMVSYIVDSIRDMQTEITRAERDLATRKKSSKRRSRKKSVEVEAEDSGGPSDPVAAGDGEQL